ncbi:tetratricopeptide repeat protein [Alphaproteobacteria bacterium LSUCC0684]
MTSIFARLALAVMLALAGFSLPSLSHAAGSGDSGTTYTTSKKSDTLKKAEKAIADERFEEAYELLSAEALRDADNADIHNLLGYSARKLGRLAESEAHYFKALSLDPKHKGALEYMGELYLTMNRPDEALKLLERLEKICWLGCDEEDELRAAITKWKETNG